MAGTQKARRAATWLLWAAPLLLPLCLPGFGALVSLLVVVLALSFHKDARRATLRWWGDSKARTVLLGIGAGIAIHFTMSILLEPVIQAALDQEVDLSIFETVRGDLANYLVLLAIGILFGGVAEELIFRGFTIGWGARLFGKAWAPALAVLSAVLFGLAHLYQGPAGMVSTGLVGLFFGIVYLSAGRRLIPCMLAHMTVNILGITELYIGQPFVSPLLGG